MQRRQFHLGRALRERHEQAVAVDGRQGPAAGGTARGRLLDDPIGPERQVIGGIRSAIGDRTSGNPGDGGRRALQILGR
jgi:hypothetical protein